MLDNFPLIKSYALTRFYIRFSCLLITSLSQFHHIFILMMFKNILETYLQVKGFEMLIGILINQKYSPCKGWTNLRSWLSLWGSCWIVHTWIVYYQSMRCNFPIAVHAWWQNNGQNDERTGYKYEKDILFIQNIYNNDVACVFKKIYCFFQSYTTNKHHLTNHQEPLPHSC